MDMDTTTTSHALGDILAAPATARGNLAGYVIRCSCGFEATNTVFTNVMADGADHLRWTQRTAQSRKAR